MSSSPSIVITEGFPDPPLLRKDDQYLMPIFIANGFRGEKLRLLNEIRMALQVITIADIATADGRSIRHSAVLLLHGNNLRTGYDWPRAVPLSDKLKALWNTALKTCLLRDPANPSARGLHFGLCVSTWTSPIIETAWDWYLNWASDRCYHRTPLGWETWIPTQGPGQGVDLSSLSFLLLLLDQIVHTICSLSPITIP